MVNPDAKSPRLETVDRFLHLTDLHFWQVVFNPLKLLNKRLLGNANVVIRRRHEFLTSQAPAFVERLESVDVRDVILTGDFTSTSTDAEFRAARGFVESLVSIGKRPIVIPGNHDVYTYESTRARRFDQYLGEWTPARSLPATSLLPGGTPVVYVPTVRPNLISSRGYISADEVIQTRENLGRVSGPIVVAGHYPLLNQTYGYSMKRARRLNGASALRDALGKYSGLMLYICGHVHRFSYVRDPSYPSLNYLTTGALFRCDAASGATGAFCEIHVGPEGYRVLRHQPAGGWTVYEEIPQIASIGACPTE